MRIFSKIAWLAKKYPLKVTSTTILLIEVEQPVHLLPPDLISLMRRLQMTVLWCWTSEYVSTSTSIQIPRPLSPPQQYSGSLYQLIWLYYYTNLGSVGSYILLLPTSKVEIWVKRQLLWQAGEDFRMWVTPAWCGWIGINASLDRNQPAS